MLVDSHCHLDYPHESKSEADLVREAQEQGVDYLVTIATDLNNLDRVSEISSRYDQVFHTAGVHPHDVKDIEDPDLEKIRQAALHPKCRAIGEIGLDYHYDHSPREVQRQRLEDQLQLALDVNLPVVIHARDAEEDLDPLLKNYASKTNKGGVIHCFTGSTEFGKRCLDLGFFISLSGVVTFKKSSELRETVRSFPLNRLMVETDSPYLAPMPYRGKPCEPWMTRINAEKLAEIFAVDFAEVAQWTTKNSRELFGI